MEKVILYYKFVPVVDPDMTRLWQIELCEKLSLKGRVIISKHGINGTLGGDLDSLRAYKRAMNKTDIFKGIDYKWSDGGSNDFPRLSIKVRPEIVSFGVPDEVIVDKNGVVNGGKHLKPEQLHKLIEDRKDDVVFFDGRNAYEAKIGKFKDAIIPNVETTKDFVKEIEDPKYENIKDKPIVTYCTGGIRCEILSSLMKNRGFKEVYQIDGGIVKYGERYGDDGEWEGKLYIFDKRMVTSFTNNAKDIGECVHCGLNTSNFVNCANMNCNKLVLVCENCQNNDYCEKCSSTKQQVAAV
ncbi:rhodanese-related sulfurtransferase [Candidatus Saccharibacteria bacterium]|nr:rhodanese-related sulfurtransferase [Candidatus Saccharibacteria bacterium]